MFEIYFKGLTIFFKRPIAFPDILSVHWNDGLRNDKKTKKVEMLHQVRIYLFAAVNTAKKIT